MIWIITYVVAGQPQEGKIQCEVVDPLLDVECRRILAFGSIRQLGEEASDHGTEEVRIDVLRLEGWPK